jgi:hypothetical protein
MTCVGDKRQCADVHPRRYLLTAGPNMELRPGNCHPEAAISGARRPRPASIQPPPSTNAAPPRDPPRSCSSPRAAAYPSRPAPPGPPAPQTAALTARPSRTPQRILAATRTAPRAAPPLLVLTARAFRTPPPPPIPSPITDGWRSPGHRRPAPWPRSRAAPSAPALSAPSLGVPATAEPAGRRSRVRMHRGDTRAHVEARAMHMHV